MVWDIFNHQRQYLREKLIDDTFLLKETDYHRFHCLYVIQYSLFSYDLVKLTTLKGMLSVQSKIMRYINVYWTNA